MTHRPAPRWQLFALLALIALILLAAFPYFERIRNANELPRLIQAMTLVEHGEWAIDGPSRRGIPVGPDVARSPEDGRLYPNKPPGASVVGAGAYLLAKIGAEPPTLREFTWWARLLAGVVPVLVLAAVIWGRLRPVYGGPITGAAICLLIFGTPLFSYARLFYGHALAACLLYCGVAVLDGNRRADGGAVSRIRGFAEAASPGQLIVGGLLAAAAVTVEYGAAFAGLPIAVALLFPAFAGGRSKAERGDALRRAGFALGGALIPVLVLAGYHWAVYGSPLSTGYHHAADPQFAALHGQGLLGLRFPTWHKIQVDLFALETGLFVWSPLCLFGVAGLIRAARHSGEKAAVARLQLGVFAIVLLVGVSLVFEGGWRVGPRYLVVALPMLTLGFAEIIEGFREYPRDSVGSIVMFALAITVAWSLAANSFAATLWPHIDPSNISEPFGAVLIPLWEGGFGPYGLPEYLDRGLTPVIAAPVALSFGLVLWGTGMARPARVLLPMMLGFGFGAMALIMVVPRSVPAHSRTEANLEYIKRVYEPRRRPGRRAVPGETRVLEPLAEP